MFSILLTLLLSASGFAGISKEKKDSGKSEESDFKIEMLQLKHSQKVVVEFEKPVNKSLTVILRNPHGDELCRFYVNTKVNVVYQNIDFTDAAEGIYKLEISDRKTTIVKQIILEHREVTELSVH